MRSDMQEVIIERPRSGSRYTYKDFRRRPEGGVRGMKRPYGYDRKSQSDVLGPLKGFLKSNVGRPWNDVWSEICKQADARTVVGSHLRDHVRYMVSLNVVVVNGEVYSTEGGRYRSQFPIRNNFYVNPDTGILCFAPYSKKTEYAKPQNNIVDYHGLQFYKHDGVWYEVTTAPIKKKAVESTAVFFDSHRNIHYNRDVFGNHLYADSWDDKHTCYNAYGVRLYCISKKQIGKRMIKKIEKFINETR